MCVGVALAAAVVVVILLLLRDLLSLRVELRMLAALVAIWEDASAICVKVCVFHDRAPTHVADGWNTDYCYKTQSQLRCLREDSRSYASSHSPPAPCAAAVDSESSSLLRPPSLHHFWGD